MSLRYITCSDPREFNDIHDIVALAQMSPRVEIAVQAHPSKMSPGMPRYEWFRELVQFVRYTKHSVNLALHVNCEWCDEICRTGKIPMELEPFFNSCRNGNVYAPLVKRWQLNMPVKTANNVNIRALKQLINAHYEKQFIVQYNNHTRDAVRNLYRANTYFSVLYDASGGRGISPDSWCAPVFSNRNQGYSGGISPENVQHNLDKIRQVAPTWQEIWIDAEGKLKTDDKFDVARARQYILNAEKWLQKRK